MSYQIQYNDFPTFLRKHFPYKVQKISLNAGFTCPNRDGTCLLYTSDAADE